MRDRNRLPSYLLQKRNQSRVTRGRKRMLLHSQLVFSSPARDFLFSPRFLLGLPLELDLLHGFEELPLHALLFIHQGFHHGLDHLQLGHCSRSRDLIQFALLLNLLLLRVEVHPMRPGTVVIVVGRLREGDRGRDFGLPLRGDVEILRCG